MSHRGGTAGRDQYDPDRDDGDLDDDFAGMLEDADSRSLYGGTAAHEVEKPRRQRMKRGWRRA